MLEIKQQQNSSQIYTITFLRSNTINIKTEHVVVNEVVFEFNSDKSHVFPFNISNTFFVNEPATFCAVMYDRYCFYKLLWS